MFNQNKSYELTTAQLKKYDGFENVTEDEAKEIIFQLEELSFILYGIFQSQQKEYDRGLSETEISNHKHTT